jgi:DNA polymerase elongation subunit (family B)
MDVLLLDAETSQVSLDSNHAAVAALRQNTRRWADPEMTWKEHDKRQRLDKTASCFLVRLWGRTADGRSVCVVVPDALSTSYRGLKPRINKSLLEGLADEVAKKLEKRGRLGRTAATASVVWRHTTNCWEADARDPGRPALLPWMRISVANADLRSYALNHVCTKAGEDMHLPDAMCPKTGEKNVEVHTEVLLGAGIRPGTWFRVPPSGAPAPCPSRVCADLVAQVLSCELRPSEAPPASAPLRVLSFDIECFSESGDFPDSSKPEDPIITIGLYAETLFGEEPRVSATALCLFDAEPGPSHETQTFETEEALLLGFAQAMRASDADVVVGYNTTLFDWPYITGRVKTLRGLGRLHEDAAAEIFRISRVRCKSTPAEDSMVASSAMGDNPLHLARMPGRFEVDLWFHLKRANNTDLPNLKLNTVAEHYLKDSKHDLPPKEIFAQFRSGGAKGRGTVAAYCVQDTKLVLDLVKKLDVVQGVTQMAAVTWVTPHDINFRGQQIKIYTQILRKARELNYVVEDTGNNVCRDEDAEYQGAHVVDPQVGHYEDPIVTLDFASLYPSIMRTWNLSPDTLVRGGCLTPSAKIPNTEHTFVRASVRRGLLPLILDELLAERKRVRKLMASCSDPLQRSLLNGSQLALKISANSCYGFTGSTKGVMTCIEVAESTTGAGRHIIHETSTAIEREWPGSSVVYGDSVTGDTALVVRRDGGAISTSRFDELVPEEAWSADETRPEKETAPVPLGLEVWSDRGFTPVLRLVRHRCEKPVVRVLTHTGLVDCTTDHSLVRSDGTEVRPEELSLGDSLLHAKDGDLLRATSRYDEPGSLAGEAFAMGLFAAGGFCGYYNCFSGRKVTWVIDNTDRSILAEAAMGLPFATSVLDRMESSGVYKLVAKGSVAAVVDRYRQLFYNKHREKRIPSEILCAPLSVVAEFWRGFHAGHGSRAEQSRQKICHLDQKGKEIVTGLWILGRRLGMKVSLTDRADKANVFRMTLSDLAVRRRRPACGIKKIRAPRHEGGFVYDLETANHHFHVGPGDLVVHNTDSCFVRLPEADRAGSAQEVFDLGERMADRVTQIFASLSEEKSYVELEMEKYFKPLVLYKKKRYAGLCFEDPKKPGKMCAKGIEMVRRDAAPLLRRTQKEVLEALVVRSDIDGAITAAKDATDLVLATRPGGPFGELAQSKTLRAKYANPDSMTHVRVAALMNQRNPGSAPRSGERISYVVVASETPRIVDKVDDVDYAEREKLPPDWVHYVNMLVEPLMRLLDVPLQSLAPDKYAELLEYFDLARRRAQGQLRAASLARHGTKWLQGHHTATGTQLKLEFPEGRLPAFTPAPVPKKRARRAPAEPPAPGARGTLDKWLTPSA